MKKTTKIAIPISIGIAVILGILSMFGISEQQNVVPSAVLTKSDEVRVQHCMQTDILVFLEDCIDYMNDVLLWCENNEETNTSICSKSDLNDFFKTIEQRIELLSIDLDNKGVISRSTLQQYIIYEKDQVVVINPIFTATAYADNGFYDYWAKKCDESCLNIPICFDCELHVDAVNAANLKAIMIFNYLNYPIITDYDFALNPDLISDFETVIMLHNEYVTQEMYDAITSHPKVMYLYPNALYNEVFVDGKNIQLIDTEHNYNHFGWEYENTRPYEFDRECKDWKFREIPQGVQLLCYPERAIITDLSLLKYIDNFVFS